MTERSEVVIRFGPRGRGACSLRDRAATPTAATTADGGEEAS
ncbi:MAG TPA: hypothetical protein VI011_19455 [Asanoa sp.]|jgi:hypothetical protein